MSVGWAEYVDTSFRLLDEDERIAVSLDCAKCGYDLRGRRMDECCSECGEAVEPSTRFAEIRVGTPEVARRIRAAARNLFVACLLGAIWPWALIIPIVGALFAMLVIPIATCQLTLVALRLSQRDSAAQVLLEGLLLFQGMLFVVALCLIFGVVASWHLPVLLVATWLLLYFGAHFFALNAMSATLDRVGIRTVPDELAFGRLRTIAGGLAISWVVIVLAAGVVVLPADFATSSLGILRGIVAVAAIVVALMQWCFTVMVLPDCVVLRNILREPPTSAWFAGRNNER